MTTQTARLETTFQARVDAVLSGDGQAALEAHQEYDAARLEPRRFVGDQCDETCTTDCGHCKGDGTYRPLTHAVCTTCHPDVLAAGVPALCGAPAVGPDNAGHVCGFRGEVCGCRPCPDCKTRDAGQWVCSECCRLCGWGNPCVLHADAATLEARELAAEAPE